MYELTDKQLINVVGGIGVWGMVSIVGIVVFLIGIIDGFVRPLKCNR